MKITDALFDSLFVQYLLRTGAYYDKQGRLCTRGETVTAAEMNKAILEGEQWFKDFRARHPSE